MSDVILEDPDIPALRPLSRFRSIFSLRDGILTPLERIRLQSPDSRIFFRHADIEYEKLIATVEGLIPAANANAAANLASDIKLHLPDSTFPFSLLDNIASRLQEDIELLSKNARRFHSPVESPEGVSVLGPRENLFLGENTFLMPGTVIDLREGTVILDSDVHVGPFSFLSGPLYVGPGSRLDNLRISGGCVLGQEVRIGGEVENSLIDDFSNKHHDGFLGHSIVGSWVNLGAGTITSDLKNNYGEVRLSLPNPTTADPSNRILIPTGRIKFGSIIGDCVKTAIATSLNTGTILDAGSSVFGGQPAQYLPPMSWGLHGSRYQIERFVTDNHIIRGRRGQIPPAELEALCHRLIAMDC